MLFTALADPPALCADCVLGQGGAGAQCALWFRLCTKTSPCLKPLYLIQQRSEQE